MNARAINGSYNLTWKAQCRSTAGNRQPVINGRRATCFSPEGPQTSQKTIRIVQTLQPFVAPTKIRGEPLWDFFLTPKPQPHEGKIHKLELCQNNALWFDCFNFPLFKVGAGVGCWWGSCATFPARHRQFFLWQIQQQLNYTCDRRHKGRTIKHASC